MGENDFVTEILRIIAYSTMFVVIIISLIILVYSGYDLWATTHPDQMLVILNTTPKETILGLPL